MSHVKFFLVNSVPTSVVFCDAKGLWLKIVLNFTLGMMSFELYQIVGSLLPVWNWLYFIRYLDGKEFC